MTHPVVAGPSKHRSCDYKGGDSDEGESLRSLAKSESLKHSDGHQPEEETEQDDQGDGNENGIFRFHINVLFYQIISG